MSMRLQKMLFIPKALWHTGVHTFWCVCVFVIVGTDPVMMRHKYISHTMLQHVQLSIVCLCLVSKVIYVTFYILLSVKTNNADGFRAIRTHTQIFAIANHFRSVVCAHAYNFIQCCFLNKLFSQ